MQRIYDLLKEYTPSDGQEEAIRERMLSVLQATGQDCLERNHPMHFAASGFIFNPDFTKVLMVHHALYQSYGWTGGHADGEDDLLSVALREAREETGITEVYPLSSYPVSLDILSVGEHSKHGAVVKSHQHLTVTFALIAPEKQTLRVCEGENTDVRWFPLSGWESYISEPHMLPVYDRCIERAFSCLREKQDRIIRIPTFLLPWFSENKRELPWRKNKTPYSVWLSEIMLQQTRVEAVKEYYNRFLSAYPTVFALADAEEERLLKLWEGLGYYNRARNLQRTAQIVAKEHRGRFPDSKKELLALPGIGEYTAGAILSIAYGVPEPAVDGNVIRVLARLTEDYRNTEEGTYKRDLTERLREIYQPSFAGDLTESLMELGATVCLPTGEPLCPLCPLQKFCLARLHNVISNLPVRNEKRERKRETHTMFLLISDDCRIAVKKRKETGLLAGLWEFPNVPGKLTVAEAGEYLVGLGHDIQEYIGETVYTHIFTHIEWEMTAHLFLCKGEQKGYIWEKTEELAMYYSLPTAFRQGLEFIKKYQTNRRKK